MRLLGAILAGGRSRRFGSDKALAAFAGKSLISHVIERLGSQVEALVVVGRDHPGAASIRDRPQAGLGPLGGLNAALAYAAANDFNAVLTSACDLPQLPLDLRIRLGTGPAVALGQPLLGLWPVALAGVLDAYLARSDDRSLRGWVAATGALPIDFGAIVNINTTADLTNH